MSDAANDKFDESEPINTNVLDRFDDELADVIQTPSRDGPPATPVRIPPPSPQVEPDLGALPGVVRANEPYIAPPIEAELVPLAPAPSIVIPERKSLLQQPLPTRGLSTVDTSLDDIDAILKLNSSTAEDEPPLGVARTLNFDDRTLPLICETETRNDRWISVFVMLAVATLYAISVFSLWAPADGGIDQNAYLIGGQQIAQHGSTRLLPYNKFQYVGQMMIVPKIGDGYYPKYPFGLPLLFAASLKLFGMARGVNLAFAISPAGSVLAVIGMFFLARTVASSFAALCSAIALATCQVMWELSNVSNSHASCVACVIWGMFFLIRWWQTGSIWRGILAGLFLGYAMTIRYTEGLLGLPIGLAVLFRIRWKNWRSYLRSAVPLFAWLIPVGALLLYNHFSIGEWTGYDSSNESEPGTGFTLAHFIDTWEQMIRTFHDQGLFFLAPLGVAGLIMLFSRSWRLAIVMLAWLLPDTALYTAYYWSPDRGVAYARFFLTVFPALLVGLAVCIEFGIMRAVEKVRRDGTRLWRVPIALPIAAGAVLAIASGVATWRAVHGSTEAGFFPGMGGDSILNQYLSHLSLAQTGAIVRRDIAITHDSHAKSLNSPTVEKGDILIAEGGRGLNNPANYLQFAGAWTLFTTSSFDSRGGRFGMMGLDNQDPNNPSPMQPRRRDKNVEIFRGLSDRDLVNEQNRTVDAAIAGGHKVFVVASRSSIDSYASQYLPKKKYDIKTLDHWKLPSPPEGLIESGTQPPGMFGRRGGFGARLGRLAGGGPPGGGPGGGGNPGGGGREDAFSEFILVEVTHAATSTSQPSTKPTSQLTASIE